MRRARCGNWFGAVVLLIGAALAIVPSGAAAKGVAMHSVADQSVTGPAGTPAAGVRYEAISRAGVPTVLIETSTHDGEVTGDASLPGYWGIPAVTAIGDAGGLSADGRWLVVTRIDYSATPRESTFLRIDTQRARMRVAERIELRGAYSFDAISPDGRLIYLIEYPDPGAALKYRVRAYDVDAGELRPKPIVDPDEAGEPMTGEPYARAMSPDGRWAYTLYSGEETFVHALDTKEAKAVCIDLPQLSGGATPDVTRFDLSVDPRSGALTVVDRGDPAVVIDPETFEIEASPASVGGAAESLDWLVWALIGGGVLLCAGVFAIQRRWQRATAAEKERSEALGEERAPESVP